MKNSAHKAFVERLKKQILSDDFSSGTGGADLRDDVCSDRLTRELETRFDALFADLENGD